MRIGILGDLSKPISIDAGGGTEVFCALLSTGLAAAGHTVSLFASPASKVPGVTIIPVSDVTRSDIRANRLALGFPELTEAEREGIDASLCARTLMIAKQHEREFDVLHDNTLSYLGGAVSDLFTVPMVTTLHMPPDGANGYVHIPQLVNHPSSVYVAVSEWQKTSYAPTKAVVYNGIDVSQYQFHEAGAEPMIWIGRVSPHAPKGLPEALEASGRTRHALRFAGNVTDQVFYREHIQPKIQANTDIVPVITSQQEKNEFYGAAKVGLFPIQWEEPFGFVFVEAMACGTPLIAFARGSVPEIIEDGVTGYIVNPSDADTRGKWQTQKTGLDGICEAIEKIYALDHDSYRKMRSAARQRVERLFTQQQMVAGYERVYRSLVPTR